MRDEICTMDARAPCDTGFASEVLTLEFNLSLTFVDLTISPRYGIHHIP
jgi:hypothetical protein